MPAAKAQPCEKQMIPSYARKQPGLMLLRLEGSFAAATVEFQWRLSLEMESAVMDEREEGLENRGEGSYDTVTGVDKKELPWFFSRTSISPDEPSSIGVCSCVFPAGLLFMQPKGVRVNRRCCEPEEDDEEDDEVANRTRRLPSSKARR